MPPANQVVRLLSNTNASKLQQQEENWKSSDCQQTKAKIKCTLNKPLRTRGNSDAALGDFRSIQFKGYKGCKDGLQPETLADGNWLVKQNQPVSKIKTKSDTHLRSLYESWFRNALISKSVILWWQAKKGIHSELEGANARSLKHSFKKVSVSHAQLAHFSTCFSSWTSPHSHLSQMLEPPCHLQDSTLKWCACNLNLLKFLNTCLSMHDA